MSAVNSSVFKRENITTIKGIANWWLNGLQYLDFFIVFYSIFHFFIIAIVFHNGWAVFLLPIFFIIAVYINLFYLSGLLLELLLLKVLRLKIDFNKYAPNLKRIIIILSVLFIICLSLLDIFKQIEVNKLYTE
jgi:hypothetical protein